MYNPSLRFLDYFALPCTVPVGVCPALPAPFWVAPGLPAPPHPAIKSSPSTAHIATTVVTEFFTSTSPFPAAANRSLLKS